MFRTLLSASTLLALCSFSPANAADLASPMASRYSAPMFTWTGFYVGLNAGYGFTGDDNVITTGQVAANVANIAGGARPGTISFDRNGFIGGAQLGYNWQSGSMVYGFETDIAYANVKDSRLVTTTNLPGAAIGPGLPLLNSYRQELEYLGTIRGRVGFAFDRALVYGTGGLAYGRVENSVNLFGPNVAPVNGALQFTGRHRSTDIGYTFGGGVEYMFTNALSVKAEYLYYSLGKTTVAANVIPGSGGGGTGYNTRFENDGHIVRAGLNYKFSSFGF